MATENTDLSWSHNRCARRNRSKDWKREKDLAERLRGLARSRETYAYRQLLTDRGLEPIEPLPPPKKAPEHCTAVERQCEHGHPLLVADKCGQVLVEDSEALRIKKAYRLLDRLRPISRNRTAQCRRFRLQKTVQVMCDGEGAWVSGVQTCNNVWGCPVCASQIQRERAQLVDYAIDQWIGYMHGRKGPAGATAHMLTLTIRHAVSHRLKTTSQLVADAWSLMFAGREGQEIRELLGLKHFVRAFEPTYGEQNGWHPHLHCVLMCDKQLTDEHLQILRERWADCVRQAGLGEVDDGEVRPDAAHGVNLKQLNCARDGRYVQKLFLELTAYGTKEGRDGNLTWWQVAELAADGDQRYIRIWKEAQDALFGRKQLTWSQGTAEAFGIKDLVEEDIASPDGVAVKDVKDVFQLEIPGRVWDEAWRRDRWFLSTVLAQVTEATRTGNWAALLALLSAELSRQNGGNQASVPDLSN